MILEHGSATYRVDKLVGAGNFFTYYICSDAETGKNYLLQVAKTTAENGMLDRAAMVLGLLKQTSDSFEKEYAKRNPKGRRLDYDRLFPGVAASFLLPASQDTRRVNVLSFKEIGSVTDLVPLVNLTKKDGMRADIGASAWMLGRLLKLLSFAHGEGVAVRKLSGGNVLFEPGHHYVVVPDWTSALLAEKISKEDARNDLVAAAKSVFTAMGGDAQTGEYPYEAGDQQSYVTFVWRLCQGRENSAERAHAEFYQMVDRLLGREFRKFVPLPL